MRDSFSFVGERPASPLPIIKTRRDRKGLPYISIGLLAVLVMGCLGAELVATKDPAYLDLQNVAVAPSGEFLFGTDTLGRDIFSCIWYGGRVSLWIGFLATVLSTVLGVVYGTLSGLAPKWVDAVLMRLTELILSIPGLLTVLFVQAIFGRPNVWSVSVAIGVTSWCSIAKIVRMEVRQIRECEYVTAARCMGGGFFYLLHRHLAPNFLPSILFMVVMNLRSAIGMETVLSFLGMGLPLETVSWGSMLSLAEKAVLGGMWWMILIPGAFLVTLMMSVTNVGNYLRKNANRKENPLVQKGA